MSHNVWWRLAGFLFALRSSNLLPGQDAYGHLTVDWAGLRVGGDVETAAFEADVPKLIGTRPILVPGDVDVMRDGLAVEGKGSGVGNIIVLKSASLSVSDNFAKSAGLGRPSATTIALIRPSRP
jgi:hypothetical protein